MMQLWDLGTHKGSFLIKHQTLCDFQGFCQCNCCFKTHTHKRQLISFANLFGTLKTHWQNEEFIWSFLKQAFLTCRPAFFCLCLVREHLLHVFKWHND